MIFCRPEVASDVISLANVKTKEGYAVLLFEVASFISCRDFQKYSFRDGGGGGGADVDIDDSIRRKRICVSLNEEQLCAAAATDAFPRSTNPGPGNYREKQSKYSLRRLWVDFLENCSSLDH